MLHHLRLPASALSTLLLFQSSVPAVAQQTPSTLSTPEELAGEFAAVPCEDKDRLAAVRALYERMGAPAPQVLP